MQKVFRYFITGAFLICFHVAQAKDSAIAILDLDKVIAEAPQSIAMRDKIELQFAPRHERILNLQESIKDDKQLLDTKNQNFSSAERAKLIVKITKTKTKLAKLEQEFQVDFLAMQSESKETVLRQVQEVTSDFAKEKSIDIVLLKDSKFGDSVFVDISDKIIDVLKKDGDL